VIDNELIAIGPPGIDLARSFDRWPMSEAAWARFLAAYRSSAPAEPAALDFWMIVTILVGARVRLQRSPERLAATLARLRRLVPRPSP
jgi:aminoglycoside phosphotransferase (APT) family kinase protein